ncbi:MAG: cytochrome oxidase [Gammaproteobacteria bacterium]|nr:MAG: cytochrome oxidase [Gammaproteobacteria bacterium]
MGGRGEAQGAPEQRYLLKFVLASGLSFLVGSIHGVVQMLPPVRAWLDSIGSPYGGPGHMIDPLAHAHINLIGGVTLLAMAAGYHLFTAITGRPIHSRRLADLSFWLTVAGLVSFYLLLLVFGAWEGELLLAQDPRIDAVHRIYSRLIPVAATVMGLGIWLYLANLLLSFRRERGR